VDGLKDALKASEPHTPLEQVESPLDMENGGIPRVFRGVQKMLGFEAAWAVVDIIIGVVEIAMGAQGGRNVQRGNAPDGQSMGAPMNGGEPVVDEFDPSMFEGE
jgi:hypothetical protein